MTDAGLILVVAGATLVLLVLILVAVARMYQRVDRSEALVINGTGEPRVSFSGALVVPLLHRAERISLAVHPIVVDRHGAESVVCLDKLRADIRVTFLVRVNRTAEDILKVAQVVGCARASDPAVLHAIFSAKFTEGLEIVARHFEFEQLHRNRDEFRDQVLSVIGRDLQGFILDDIAIDRLQHVPLEALDPNNLFDAEAIRKLTDQTSRHNIATNELRRREATEIAHQNLIADEQLYRIERQRAESEAHERQQLAITVGAVGAVGAGIKPATPANR